MDAESQDFPSAIEKFPCPISAGGSAAVGFQERALAGLVFLACLALLFVAGWLTPSADGHGTHTQLGLPPCAWEVAFNKPCMTCGMTTAFAYAAHGNLPQSAIAQPFGFFLAILTSVVAWGALHVLLTGSALGVVAGRLLTKKVYWILGTLFFAAWVYKLLTWKS